MTVLKQDARGNNGMSVTGKYILLSIRCIENKKELATPVVNHCGICPQLWFETNCDGRLLSGSYVYMGKDIFISVQM